MTSKLPEKLPTASHWPLGQEAALLSGRSKPVSKTDLSGRNGTCSSAHILDVADHFVQHKKWVLFEVSYQRWKNSFLKLRSKKELSRVCEQYICEDWCNLRSALQKAWSTKLYSESSEMILLLLSFVETSNFQDEYVANCLFVCPFVLDSRLLI